MTRLPYETQAGYVSRDTTLTQATEYTRLLAECLYTVSHIDKANGDEVSADNFLKMGQKIEQMCKLIGMMGRGPIQ